MDREERLQLVLKVHQQCGFTLVEVLVAMAVLLLGLVPLLQLHVGSLRGLNRTHLHNEASMIARSKLAEVLAEKGEQLHAQRGRLDSSALATVYEWSAEVVAVDDKAPEVLENLQLSWADVRQVTVTVSWRDGQREDSLSLSAYHLTAMHENQRTGLSSQDDTNTSNARRTETGNLP
ncbi:prepilin-type N-terminal cleavage/methylation domain-containing protein [Planctomycetota bacterium]